MTDNNDIFAGEKSIEEIRIEESKKILIDAGYRIIEPLEINNDVNDMQKLRRYFYEKLWAKYPDRLQMYIQYYKEEMKVIREFVTSREEGTNRKAAIQECIAIIDVIFDYEEEFKLDRPIVDIMILRVGWIISTAISILNINKDKEKEISRDKMIDEIEDQYMKNNYEKNMKIQANKLDKILSAMEKNSGKIVRA